VVNYNPSRPEESKRKKVQKWKQGLKKNALKNLNDDFNKSFYFQFGGFKTLGSEVF
jgi:hypothetical protein